MQAAASSSLILEFADGEYLMDLKLPQLAELQRVCDAGIFTIYGRTLRGRYVMDGEVIGLAHDGAAFVSDLFETVRLALIGGGRGTVNGAEIEVSALTAKRLVETYLHPAPLREAWTLAAAILSAKVEGYDPRPKAKPAKAPASGKARSRTASNRSKSEPTA